MSITSLRRALPLIRHHALSRRLTTGDKAPPPAKSSWAAEVEARKEAYKQLEDLDFMKAAKILFTTPPKRKKFGLDFHLVQLFFACLPSLAVYLVAQYARYEIRRMEAEVDAKKKVEEEEKAKEAKLRAEEGPEAELSRVKHRLDALEETVKEIAVEKRKITNSSLSKDQEVPPDSKSDPQAQQIADRSSNNNNAVSGSGSPASSKKESSTEINERSSAPTKK